nr:PREDICTED: uncharacterized protein LOC109029769 [Bemisia tabaci]
MGDSTMELFINCFFDQVFTELDRGSLIPRYKRKQLVDYFSTIIYGCCRGDSDSDSSFDAQAGCRKAVTCALDYHEAMRAKNRNLCLLGKYHAVVYVALKISFDWKLRDAPTLTRLLENVFTCEATFERIFEGAIFGPKITHLISGWKSDFANRAENIDAVAFFLDHAAAEQLEFPSLGTRRRLIDIPMTSYNQMTPAKIAAQAAKLDVLTLLVRYGAVLTDERHPVKFCAFQPVLYKLNACCEEEKELPADFLACLELLLRAVERIPNLFPEDSEAESSDDFVSVHPELIERGIVPLSKVGLEPVDLKHLSRCAVRRALNDSWQLPHGIQRLDVPGPVKQYLDLEVD